MLRVMSKGRFAAVLAAMVLAVSGDSAAQARSEGQGPPFKIHPVRVHGVIRLPNGKPAVKQKVKMRVAPREEPYTLTTGRDGRYSLTIDNAGHLVEVRVAGVGWSKALPLKPRLAVRDLKLDVQLCPFPLLTGRVYLPDGRPAAKVTLASFGTVSREMLLPSGSYVPPNVSGWGMSGGAGVLGPTITTDREGRYRIPLGRDAKGRFNLQNGSVYNVYLFARGGEGWLKLTDLRVQAGPAEIKRDLRLRHGDRLEGLVLGYPGKTPMPGVRVEVTLGIGFHGPGVTVAKAVTDKAGRYRITEALPPKACVLVSRPPAGYGQMETRFDPPLSQQPETRYAEIGLAKDYTVRGHIYGTDGKPLANRRVRLGLAACAPNRPGILGPSQSNTVEVTTGADGSYELPRKTDPNAFWGSAQSHWLLVAPRPSDLGVARPQLVDATDPEMQTVDFHLAQPAVITGRQVEVHTGKPGVGVRARLAAAGWLQKPHETAPINPLSAKDRVAFGVYYYDVDRSQPKDDLTGQFILRGVPPGVNLLEFEGSTIHDLTGGYATGVTADAGQTVDVGPMEVTYVPHSSGVFSGLPGKQQEGMVGDLEVRCALRPAGGKGEWRQAFVDLWQGEGRYTVWGKDLPEGRYDALLLACTAEQPRYVTPLVKGVELREDGKSKEIPVRFTRGASVSGRVVQADGKPLAVSITARAVSGEALAISAATIPRWMGGLYLQVETDQHGGFRVTGLPPGEYELTAHVSEAYYGAKPKLKVQVTRDQQKTGLVLRAARSW